jgi:hypothetical protein
MKPNNIELMENKINRKDSNRLLIAAIILSILLTSLVWWLLTKPAKPIQTKGSFPAVAVKPSETKSLPEIKYIHDGVKTIVDSTGVIIFRGLYNLTKKELKDFNKWMFGQTVPIGGVYEWDLKRWLGQCMRNG